MEYWHEKNSFLSIFSFEISKEKNSKVSFLSFHTIVILRVDWKDQRYIITRASKEGNNAKRKEFLWQWYECNTLNLYIQFTRPKVRSSNVLKKKYLFRERGESRITISRVVNEARGDDNPAKIQQFSVQQVCWRSFAKFRFSSDP